MQAAGDEGGDELWPQSRWRATPDHTSDAEATRHFTRLPQSPGETPAETAPTASRETALHDEATAVFHRSASPPPDPTRTMARPWSPGDDSAAADVEPREDADTIDAEGDLHRREPYRGTPSDHGDADRTREMVRRRREPRRRPEPPPPAQRRRSRLRWLRPGRLIALVLALCVALPCGTWVWVWWVARQDDRPTSDAIVVLGASQYNGRPSPIFEARLDHAAGLYEEGVAPTIITVGGNQPGDNYTEGGSGRTWLVESGIPGDHVIGIGEGSDTLQSLRAVSEVYEQRGWDSAVIVTDPWHSLRSRLMAEDLSIDAATSPSRSGPAVRERTTQLWYITRETASLWWYWIVGESSGIEVDAAL
ncbi:YdcF family protein [Salinactinospora qingdaonensis]|uniref:DUF218 domain-containing protein n=1 Tax=Salinactinospora qingdaonensis TaxID=702744 RepID=A0ABP7FXG0_9ACTN